MCSECFMTHCPAGCPNYKQEYTEECCAECNAGVTENELHYYDDFDNLLCEDCHEKLEEDDERFCESNSRSY